VHRARQRRAQDRIEDGLRPVIRPSRLSWPISWHIMLHEKATWVKPLVRLLAFRATPRPQSGALPFSLVRSADLVLAAGPGHLVLLCIRLAPAAGSTLARPIGLQARAAAGGDGKHIHGQATSRRFSCNRPAGPLLIVLLCRQRAQYCPPRPTRRGDRHPSGDRPISKDIRRVARRT